MKDPEQCTVVKVKIRGYSVHNENVLQSLTNETGHDGISTFTPLRLQYKMPVIICKWAFHIDACLGREKHFRNENCKVKYINEWNVCQVKNVWSINVNCPVNLKQQ